MEVVVGVIIVRAVVMVLVMFRSILKGGTVDFGGVGRVGDHRHGVVVGCLAPSGKATGRSQR